MKNFLLFLVCMAIPLATGFIAGQLTMAEVDTWYQGLRKPSFNPPNTIFGPVWTTLYALMGISFYMVIKQPPSSLRNRAITVFFVQLVLNFAWSVIFFNLHAPGAALIDIILLWCCILWMIVLFYKISKPASVLQWPYLAWVSFASVLNASIFMLN